MSNVTKSNQVANRSREPIKEQASCLSNLTVENVTKLELEYDPLDGERRKVEDYIRKNQQVEELKTIIGISPSETKKQDLVERETNTTVDDRYRSGSAASEKTVERGTSDDGTNTLKQLPLSSEEDPLREMEAIQSFCEFCHLPKKPFPSIEQLASKPGSMEPKETIAQCYNSGQNFLIHFPDGTGQVLYPSGNIGLLIACSKPTQFIFIILEDTEKKPHIQAVFMSNGHAACYHLNGTLWTVLDPCGGSYFDENGAQKKKWTWWDFSQHVHAPPFQPITLMLNSNVEVKILKQDQVYLSFTKDKEKVTFNVGAKLLLKDPGITSKLKWSTGETELYCSSKKLEIFRLLNKIRKLVRISAKSKEREKTIQNYIYQLQKSLNDIITLTNKQDNTSNSLKTKKLQGVTAVMKKTYHHSGSTLSSKTELLKGEDKRTGRHTAGTSQKESCRIKTDAPQN
ncbi:glutamate-rich protein 6B isoform X4 [Dendropsophus ebraccatus]|uniref:glutamate-rich protein 6B isoform X4 n=1 Tax=Dendropsophus ebraccatus TaxID=150705 RepID=UPI0038320F39